MKFWWFLICVVGNYIRNVCFLCLLRYNIWLDKQPGNVIQHYHPTITPPQNHEDRTSISSLKTHPWITEEGQVTLANQEDNCQLVEVNDQEVANAVTCIKWGTMVSFTCIHLFMRCSGCLDLDLSFARVRMSPKELGSVNNWRVVTNFNFFVHFWYKNPLYTLSWFQVHFSGRIASQNVLKMPKISGGGRGGNSIKVYPLDSVLNWYDSRF